MQKIIMSLTPLDKVGQLQLAKKFISIGAEIDKTHDYSNLWRIADKELAQMLIDHGVDFNHTFNGNALMLTNDSEVAELLIKAGISLKLPEGDSAMMGETPLMRGEITRDHYFRRLEEKGISREIGELVEAGHDVSDAEKDAGIAREVIQQSKDNTRKIIKLLIDAGVDVNAASYTGATALSNTDDPETIKLLLAAGANPNGGKAHEPAEHEALMDKDELEELHSNTKELPLISSILNPESLNLLLAAGADPNGETIEGATPLIVLFTHDLDIQKKRQIAQILINAGADINYKTKNYGDGFFPFVTDSGTSVLTHIIKIGSYNDFNQIDMLKLALELGADVNLLCNKHLDLEIENQDVINILKLAGANCLSKMENDDEDEVVENDL